MRKIIVVIMAVLALSLSTGCRSHMVEAKTNTSDTSVKSGETINIFGAVKSNNKKDVYIDFDATVDKADIKEGKRVKKGEVLLTLNYEDYKKDIDKKDVELKSAQLCRENWLSDIEKQKEDLENLQEQLNSESYPELKKLKYELELMTKSYDEAVQELKLQDELLDNGKISQGDYNSFKKNILEYEKSVIELKSQIEIVKYNLKKEIKTMKHELDKKSRTIEGTDGTIINCDSLNKNSIKSLEKELKLMKEKTKSDYIEGDDIVSEMDDAIIYDVGFVEGEKVDTEKKMFSLVDANSLVVEGSVPEEFINDIKLGQQVRIIPQSNKGKAYNGSITYIAKKATKKTGETTVLVEASIDDNDGLLLPDYSVTLEMDLNKTR